MSRFPAELAKPENKPDRAAKSTVAYWQNVVCPRLIRGKPTAELYVRLRYKLREAWVCLDTSNRITAAGKARGLWDRVKVLGLDAALAEFHPKSAPRYARSATVGELLAEAKALATVRPSTLAQYETSLRRLVAGVLGMKHTPAVCAAKSPENLAWRAKVEGASLDILTTAKVEAWRKAYVDTTADEKARISRRNTTSCAIRNARGFFTPALAKALADKIRMPDPLPLAEVSAPASTRRFKTTVDARQLYAAALAELKGDDLTAFLLCITAGLRKGEVDLLPWEHVDLDAALVTVAPTRYFLPKTEESQRSTPIPPDVVAHLRRRRALAPKAGFVLAGRHPSEKRDPKDYRCRCWKTLAAWLRAKGFVSPNPIHELRKVSGSLVNAVAGLEAARRHLGHRSITTTAGSYVAGSAALVNLAGEVSQSSGQANGGLK